MTKVNYCRFQDIASTKTRSVSWLVSNCHSDNHREDYVEELRKYSKGISCKVYLFTCYFVTNKNFFYHIYVTKIMIYLAWVAYSMVVLSASYRHWNSLHLSHRFLLFFSLFLSSFSFFSRVHATLQLALSDCPSVRRSNFTFFITFSRHMHMLG